METVKIGPLTNTNRAIGLADNKPVIMRPLSIVPLTGSNLIFDSTSSIDIIFVTGRQFSSRTPFLMTIVISRDQYGNHVYGSMINSEGHITKDIKYKIDGNRIRVWVGAHSYCNAISLTGSILNPIPEAADNDAIAL